MRILGLPQFKILLLCFSVSYLSGCIFAEDKGAIENVGTPVSGEGDFTVSPPPSSEVSVEVPASSAPLENTDLPNQGTLQPEFRFTIDNGRPYTEGEEITLSISTDLPTYLYYKISPNENCEGGTWVGLDESLSAEVKVTNFLRNSNNQYSVRFKDVDSTPADCLKASIVHDNQGPDILFTKYPMAILEEGASSEIIAEVKDVSPIMAVTCSMNSISKNCLAGTNIIQLSQLPAGQYHFSITATDIHGHSNSKSISWTVVNKAKLLTQTVLIKDDRKVDVLIVIDNSGSMEYEQRSMGNRVKNMLSVLRGLDYRIAVTTTDPGATRTSNGIKYYGDGDLIPISGQTGKLWIDSLMDESVAQQSLSQTLQRPETGSGSEQAIRATYRFIERATTPSSSSISTFFREGANFATLVISDEDESANTEKNDPEKLLQLIASKFSGQKAFSWHSIITKPGDLSCKNTHGATYGERYKKITNLTGGILGSVCEADYATQVSGVATEIRNLIKNITLSCEPLSGYSIQVIRNGVAYAVPFTLEGLNLKFASELEPGEYKVDYACLK